MAGSGDPGWAKLAGAHTDAHRERIRCSDGCLNRLIGPALGEIGDRWRDGESERGREARGGKRVRWGTECGGGGSWGAGGAMTENRGKQRGVRSGGRFGDQRGGGGGG